MSFLAGKSNRAVFIYPAGTREPNTRDVKQTIYVPDHVTTPDGLWQHIKSYNRLVEAVYEDGNWVMVNWFSDELSADPLDDTFTVSVREKLQEPRPSGPVSLTLLLLSSHARDKAAFLIKSYSADPLTVESLSVPGQWKSIASLYDEGSFNHMGRECTRALIEFLQGSEQANITISIVTGTKRSGKTYSSRAASLFLFLELYSSRQGRLMYIDWRRFLLEPVLSLLRSLALAYHDSHTAESYIERVKSSEDTNSVIKYMRKIATKDGKKLYIVIEGCKDPTAHQILIQRMTTFAIVVLSGSPKLWELERKQGKSMLITGGFTNVELQKYLEHHGCQLDLSKKFTTGWVPGFVDHCIKNGGTFDDSKYIADLNEYMILMPEQDWAMFTEVLAGGRVPRRFLGESTGLFYKGEDGKAVCLTGRLQKYANIQLAEMFCREDEPQIDGLIRQWTTPVIQDSRLGSRAGLNAEAACILVCRHKQPVIPYGTGRTVKIAPKSVTTFPGSFNMRLTDRRSVATLYIPELGTEEGLDAYYVDDEHFVCFQFATGSRAAGDRIHTRTRAQELFQADDKGRTCVLAWIVYTVQSWSQEQQVAVEQDSSQVTYHEVFMKFGDFDASLRCIGERLALERGNLYGGECSKCGLRSQCEKCSHWYHDSCSGEEICAGCAEENKRKKEVKQEKARRLKEEKDAVSKELQAGAPRREKRKQQEDTSEQEIPSGTTKRNRKNPTP